MLPRRTRVRDDVSSSCRHGGLEDVVVLVQKGSSWFYRWVVLDPSQRDWVAVTTVTIP